MNETVYQLVTYWAEYRDIVGEINFEVIESDKYGQIRPTVKPNFVGFMDFLRGKL